MPEGEKPFPGFPRKPTHNLFPVYGYIPHGNGWMLECDVRKRTGPQESRSEIVNPIPGVIRTRREAEARCADLNSRVWMIMKEE